MRDAYRRDYARHLFARREFTLSEVARRLRFKTVRGFNGALARWLIDPREDTSAERSAELDDVIA
ncbi:hypothetical protein BH09MYX1_BH09MYX1_56570 [soil metagenome]